MDARWCGRCGQPLLADARFCSRCGTAVAVRGPAGFVHPRWRGLDTLVVGVWLIAVALALGAALGSLTIPPPGHTVAVGAAVWWLVRVLAVLVGAGAVYGVFVRVDSRYREVALSGYLLGWLVSWLVLGVWVDMHTSPSDCPRADPCDTPAEALGTVVFAAIAAVVVMLAGLAGRFGRRRIRRTSPRAGHL